MALCRPLEIGMDGNKALHDGRSKDASSADCAISAQE